MTAQAGQTDFVRALVARGVRVNLRGFFGATARHFATNAGNAGLARDLVAMGANPEIRTMSGQTALHPGRAA